MLPIWNKESPGHSWSLNFSNKYVREGSHSLRFELRNTDNIVNGSKRCEISRNTAENSLTEHIYRFSIYLPIGDEDYKFTNADDEVIAQWHNVPDPGEEWTFPPLSLHIGGNGDYILWRVWDDSKLSTNESILNKGNYQSYNIGNANYDKGKWIDWVFNIKWGWLSSHNPVVNIQKQIIGVDDSLKNIINISGPNTTNDKNGLVQKLGIYKPQWVSEGYGGSKITKRIAYYDRVWID
jgi:hypothetical protein